jgi:geranylgeranyl pyrophosphate synthase
VTPYLPLILPSPSIPYARDRAAQYVSAARSAAAELPDGEARQVLQAMAEFAVKRPM